MNRSSIRHIATSYKGSKCAAAQFERLVYIWDIKSGQKISQFDTCLDYGGHRLAISEDGGLVATGSYKHTCIAIHRSSDGFCFWQRKDLGQVQYLLFDLWENALWVCLDDASCHLLDMKEGLTIKSLKDALTIVTSPYHSELLAIEQKEKISIIDRLAGKELFYIKKETFAVLSIAFTPNSICISESGGGQML